MRHHPEQSSPTESLQANPSSTRPDVAGIMERIIFADLVRRHITDDLENYLDNCKSDEVKEFARIWDKYKHTPIDVMYADPNFHIK